MKLSTAISILLTAPTTSLNINPHQRRYNDVIINTALSSTAYDTRAPPVSVGENYNDRNMDVDFISSALLESPPLGNQFSHVEKGVNGFNAAGLNEEWSENYEFEQLREVQMKQRKQPQQQFRHNSHQSIANNRHLSQPQQQHHHRVMTGSERRSTWESYAQPGVEARHINSHSGGEIGSPNGIGDWEYTSMYGPATSVSDSQMRVDTSYPNRGYNSQDTRAQSPSSDRSYNMGNTIGFGSQRPSNRQPPHRVVGGTVMTGAQRRAGFQNIHSYEPNDQSVRYQLPDANSYDRFDSVDYSDEISDGDASLNSFQPAASALKVEDDTSPQNFVTNDVQLSKPYDELVNNQASFNGFKAAPALEVEENARQDNAVTKSSISSSTFSPLMPKQGSSSAPFNGAASPSFKGSKGASSPIIMSNTMLKGPGIGLKGKRQSKAPFGNSSSTPPFKGTSTPLFKGAKAPSFKGSEPIYGMQKSAESLKVKSDAPSKGVFGSTSVNGFGGGLNKYSKMGPGGIGLKGKERNESAFSDGIKSSNNDSNLVGGMEKTSRFGKNAFGGLGGTVPKSKGVFGSDMKVGKSNLNGLFGKSKSSLNSVSNMTAKQDSGPAAATPNKFKPFVPSTNENEVQTNDQGATSFNGFKQTASTGAFGVGAGSTSNAAERANSIPNKFKPFVPSFKDQHVQEEEAPSKQDLASFLQNPSNTKRDAKDVAASLSALSSPPIFYNDFESSESAQVSSIHNDSADLNFAISNGVVEDMPSPSEVPMNTPARQSLPPYLSLHPIPGKGLGVITNKAFKIGEFIGNYEGEIMSEEVKDRRYLKSLEHKLTDEDREWMQNRLDRGQTITGTYLYGVDLDVGNAYKHFGRKHEDTEEETPDRIFVDAEDEYESLWTRFINHASPPLDNLKPMSVPESYDGKPRVWFMAKRDIEPGEELCFDYGEDYWLEGDEVY